MTSMGSSSRGGGRKSGGVESGVEALRWIGSPGLTIEEIILRGRMDVRQAALAHAVLSAAIRYRSPEGVRRVLWAILGSAASEGKVREEMSNWMSGNSPTETANRGLLGGRDLDSVLGGSKGVEK